MVRFNYIFYSVLECQWEGFDTYKVTTANVPVCPMCPELFQMLNNTDLLNTLDNPMGSLLLFYIYRHGNCGTESWTCPSFQVGKCQNQDLSSLTLVLSIDILQILVSPSERASCKFMREKVS